jgi:phosphoribosyl-ATP pyrophosphohydrolase
MSDDDITFNQFQEEAQPTKSLDYEDLGPSGVTLYWSNGLGGESGEVQNAVKKIVRDGISKPRIENLIEESGDVLFYLAHLLERYGFTLEDAAAYCLTKLYKLRNEAGQDG